MSDDEHYLQLRNPDRSRVDPGAALVFWDELQKLDQPALNTILEMAHGGYEQEKKSVDVLADGGFLDDNGELLPLVRHLVQAAVVKNADGAVSIGLPFDPEDKSAAQVWAVRRGQQDSGFARLIESLREPRAPKATPER